MGGGWIVMIARALWGFAEHFAGRVRSTGGCSETSTCAFIWDRNEDTYGPQSNQKYRRKPDKKKCSKRAMTGAASPGPSSAVPDGLSHGRIGLGLGPQGETQNLLSRSARIGICGTWIPRGALLL